MTENQMTTETFIFFMDCIGSIAFAISGAVLAIRKNMDIFGVCILAVVTATGGGVIRDILMGKLPPVMFTDPTYVILALVAAVGIFLFFKVRKSRNLVIPAKAVEVYTGILFWFDTVGLAAFTVDGVYAGFSTPENNLFLSIFVGVITGVGGGLLRDIFADEMPAIFVKHVYAVASIAGAFATGFFLRFGNDPHLALLIGFAVTVLIRYLAAHFRWNLPRV